MPPRRRRPTPRPPVLDSKTEAVYAALERLINAGHITRGSLRDTLHRMSPARILAEADRLCGKAPARKTGPTGRRPRAAAPSGSFDIEVSLQEIRPRIWRRFTIQSSETFLDLHEAIQDAGDWMNYHLFAFRDAKTGAAIAGLPDPDDTVDSGPFAGDVRLDSVFPTNRTDRILYEYDFGDGWQLDVACRAHIPAAAPWHRRLTGGERAFPPEDCGGVPGYEECLEAVSAEKPTEEQAQRQEWLGAWNPEAFILEKAAKRFDRKKRRRTGHYLE